MSIRVLIGWMIRPLVIGGALAFGLSMTGLLLGALWFTRPEPAQPGQVTAVVNVIPAATFTPPLPTSTATPQVTPTNQAVLPPPPPGVISVGIYVQITGTEGDGLRLRTDPGLDSDVRNLAAESEIFEVKDGPREAGGYTWWYLVAPFDESRRGWAVANYLSIAQNP